MNLIEAKKLTKSYNNQIVVNRINMRVNKGQLTALLGTNGAGKSTTIAMLIGLLKPTSGEVKYNSENNRPVKIGVVFQQSVLDEELTVKQNLKIRAKLYQNQSTDYFEKLVKVTGLTDFMDQKYGRLSGGQKRRADIARALLNQPDILFLDEPTTGLDIQTRQAIWSFIQSLQKNEQLTVFLTTHYLEEAQSAEQIYIMSKGELVGSGSAEEINQTYSMPTLKLVAKDVDALKQRLSLDIASESNHVLIVYPKSASQAIAILEQVKAFIVDFEFKPGDLNDAFVTLTGRKMK